MTIEEKVKAYDEMMQRIKELHKTGNALTKNQMEIICPELVESEDERIRNEIIDFIEWAEGRGCIRNDYHQAKRPAVWLTYLEKQKEKMTAEEYEKSELFQLKLKTQYANGYQDGLVQKEQSITANDLDEEIHRFFDDCIDVHEAKLYGNISERVIPLDCYELTARHFAKWGEKHKEQKPEVDESTKRLNENWMKQYFDEQKPVEYLSKKKVYDIMNKLTELSTSELIPVKSKEYVKIHEITSDVRSLLDYPIEQKPEDDKAFEEWINDWWKEHKEKAYPQVTMDEKEFKNFCRGIRNMYQQKSVEWSEEDSDNLERVDNYLWMLDDYVGDDYAMPQGKTDNIRGNIQGILSPWIKSLPERFNLQPKQEWSKEDEEALREIKLNFELNHEDMTPALVDCYERFFHKVETIRPQQKHGWRRYIWAVNLRFDYDGLVRYEDNGSYEIVIAGNKPKRQVNGEYILLKDIQSIDWKPSEEQIEALRVYLYHPQSIRNSEDVKIKLVESLYKDIENYFGHEI